MRNKKRRGRPSKAAVRYPSGQPIHASRGKRGETEVQIMATAKAYRSRMVGSDQAISPLAGYELGRLLMRKAVTEREHRAGVDYATIYADWRRAMDIPSPTIPAIEYGAARGQSLTDLDAEWVRRAVGRHMGALTALGEHGRSVESDVFRVCVMDEGAESVDKLKIGLTALADFFKVPVDDEEFMSYRKTC